MFLQGFSKSQGLEEILQFRPIVLFEQGGTTNDADDVVEIVVDDVDVVDDNVEVVVDVVEVVEVDDVVVDDVEVEVVEIDDVVDDDVDVEVDVVVVGAK